MQKVRYTGPSPEDTCMITEPRAVSSLAISINAYVVSCYYTRLSPLDCELFEDKECILLLVEIPKADGEGFQNECMERTVQERHNKHPLTSSLQPGQCKLKSSFSELWK